MFKPMRYLKICIAIYTDVSFEGWGFSMGHISTWRRGGGGGEAWLRDEKQMHINVLELKAVLLSRKSFVKTSYKHIKIMSENTTAIHCINKMVTLHSMECHHQVLKI